MGWLGVGLLLAGEYLERFGARADASLFFRRDAGEAAARTSVEST